MSKTKSSPKNDSLPALTDARKVTVLLMSLERRKGLSADEAVGILEEKGLATGLRSVQRLLAGLAEDPHFPVTVRKNERPYRYCWDEKAPAWIFPVPAAEEKALLHASRLFTEKTFPGSLLGFVTQTDKALGNFPLRLFDERLPVLPAKIKSDVWSAVTRAADSGHYLKIKYRDNRRTFEKTVHALGLTTRAGIVTLVAREQGENTFLTVPLHRIMTAFLTAFEPLVKRKGEFEAALESLRLDPARGNFVTLTFRTKDKALIASLRETPLSGTQKIKEEGETATVTCLLSASPLLDRWLHDMKDKVEDPVLTPFPPLPEKST